MIENLYAKILKRIKSYLG